MERSHCNDGHGDALRMITLPLFLQLTRVFSLAQLFDAWESKSFELGTLHTAFFSPWYDNDMHEISSSLVWATYFYKGTFRTTVDLL